MLRLLFLFTALLGCKADAQDATHPIYYPQDPTLINGREAHDGEFPEAVYIRVGNSRCSATLVGPKALITAAHCVSNGDTATFTYGDSMYRSTCTRSSLYPRKDHDIALCLVEAEIKDLKYAIVDKRAVVGEKVTHAGYGCVRPGGGGGNDGILRTGTADIIRFQGYDFVSKGGAALCYGDSGGPAYHYLNDDGRNKTHYIIGVNSKGNISDTSYLARLDTQESKDFMEKWAQDNSAQICGVNLNCEEEEEPGPEPEPEPEPEPGTCVEKMDRAMKVHTEMYFLLNDLRDCLR